MSRKSSSRDRSKRPAAEVLRWVEQLECTRRWFRRFERLTNGSDWQGKSRAEAVDEVYAFFLNCYHVKDWVKRDASSLDLTEQEIEDFVTQTAALALCAQICNGLKHLELRELRSGIPHTITDARVSMEFVKTAQTTARLLQRVRITIQHGEKTIDAFDLATDAMQAWDTLLQPRLSKLMAKL